MLALMAVAVGLWWAEEARSERSEGRSEGPNRGRSEGRNEGRNERRNERRGGGGSPVVVVGTGLAGLATALALAEGGSNVVMLEAEERYGGNSLRASSGINGATTRWQTDVDAMFDADTLRSGGGRSEPALVAALVGDSRAALEWLVAHGVEIDQVVKLGGHSVARTHRGARTMGVGLAIMSRLWARAQAEPRIRVEFGWRVQDVEVKDGVWQVTGEDGRQIAARDAVLATGGFAANDAWVRELRPDLAGWPTTSGPQATGVLLRRLVARYGGRDLDQIQVHPTGFVDPARPEERTKTLAAEILRGAGATLHRLDTGARFCDELDTREAIYQAMKATGQREFELRVPARAREVAPQHVAHYEALGLLQKTADGWTGRVTPVVHYCMGGLRIDANARVVGAPEGLLAVGEATGGVHGANRLGGNSLLECVVFGRRAAAQVLARPVAANVTVERLEATRSSDGEVVIRGQRYGVPESVVRLHPRGTFEKRWGRDVTEEFIRLHGEDLVRELVRL